MLTSFTYFVYLTLSIVVTVYVSRTLRYSGLAFLIEGFGGNVELAKSTLHPHASYRELQEARRRVNEQATLEAAPTTR
ncbi:MAG: hypothetical protein AAGA68_07595 [Pseudomonadota bacterium]